MHTHTHICDWKRDSVRIKAYRIQKVNANKLHGNETCQSTENTLKEKQRMITAMVWLISAKFYANNTKTIKTVFQLLGINVQRLVEDEDEKNSDCLILSSSESKNMQ